MPNPAGPLPEAQSSMVSAEGHDSASDQSSSPDILFPMSFRKIYFSNMIISHTINAALTEWLLIRITEEASVLPPWIIAFAVGMEIATGSHKATLEWIQQEIIGTPDRHNGAMGNVTMYGEDWWVIEDYLRVDSLIFQNKMFTLALTLLFAKLPTEFFVEVAIDKEILETAPDHNAAARFEVYLFAAFADSERWEPLQKFLKKWIEGCHLRPRVNMTNALKVLWEGNPAFYSPWAHK